MANVQRVPAGMAPPPGASPGGQHPGQRPTLIQQGQQQHQTIVLARPGMQGMSPAGGIRPQFANAAAIRGAGGQLIGGPGPPVGMRVARPPPGTAGTTTGRPIRVPTVAGGGGGNLVINNPGLAPGQPGSQITVPLQALQGLRPGEGIPTGQANHLLVKTENNQYQILRVESSGAAGAPVSAMPPTAASAVSNLRPITTPALPTRPVGVPPGTRPMGAPPASVVGGVVSGMPPKMSASIAPSSMVTTMGRTMTTTSAAATGVAHPPTSVSRAAAPTPSAAPPPPTSAASGGSSGSSSGGGGGGMGGQMTPDIAKLKCKNFLATLLKLASEQPAQVATNVRHLIQGLIDGKVEPEVFTTKLQKELSSSPQPCLVPFLKKSLPYLQQSLASGELTIDGVRAPQVVANRLPAGLGAPPTGIGTVRGVQVRPPTSNVIYPSGAAVAPVRTPTNPAAAGVRSTIAVTQFQNPALMAGAGGKMTAAKIPASSSPLVPKPGAVGLSTPTSRPPTAVLQASAAGAAGKSPMISTTTIQKIGSAGGVVMKTISNAVKPPVPGGGVAGTASPLAPKPGAAGMPGTSITPLGKQPPFSTNNLQPPPPPSFGTTISKRPFNGPTSSGSAAGGGGASSSSAGGGGGGSSYSTAGDDDINDVAAMGGVNLAEETQRMAAGIDLISNQVMRSCGKDETFLQTGLLHSRVARLCRDRGLEDPPPEVINLVSHATQERLKTLLEKLAVIAEHRLDVIVATEEGDKYDVTQNVRGQIKFLNELEKIERKRHDEAERELLFRAAKSRTKTEDPEKEKLRAKAKELQRFEEEQLKHEKANSTAMLAIGGGPRKKMRTDDLVGGSSIGGLGGLSSSTSSSTSGGPLTLSSGAAPASLANRPRTKRVHLRDLLFLMEQEKQTKRSPLLWKSLSS